MNVLVLAEADDADLVADGEENADDDLEEERLNDAAGPVGLIGDLAAILLGVNVSLLCTPTSSVRER